MRKANSKTAVKGFVYGVGLLAALFFLSRTVRTTASAPQAPRSKRATTAEVSLTSAKEAAGPRLVQAAPEDAARARYQVIVGRNIFAPPGAKDDGTLPPLKTVMSRMTPPIVIAPRTEAPVTVAAVPLTGWSYVGYYAVNGLKKGVIQNDNNNSAKDLAVGDDFLGYKVRSISGEEIVLAAGAMPVTLKRPLDFPVVPLQGMTAQAQPTAPGPPRGRPGMRPGT